MKKSKVATQNNVIVVIPYLNEEKYIQKTLACFGKQKKLGTLSFKILFVDNQSQDKTSVLINEFCSNKGINFQVIYEKRRGTVYARTTGLYEASKQDPEVIISTDADTIVPEDFIQKTYSDVMKGDSQVLSGRLIKDKRVDLWQRSVSKRLFNIKRHFWNLEYEIFGPYIFGAYFAIRNSFFSEIKHFDPWRHERFMGEDILLSRRCYYMGADFKRSSVEVNPSIRRFTYQGSDFLETFVGNNISSHLVKPSEFKLTYKKLPIDLENKLIKEMIDFESMRFLWMLGDAHNFWKKTHEIYPVAKESTSKALEWLGEDKAFLNEVNLPNLKTIHSYLVKKLFSKTVELMINYVDEGKKHK